MDFPRSAAVCLTFGHPGGLHSLFQVRLNLHFFIETVSSDLTMVNNPNFFWEFNSGSSNFSARVPQIRLSAKDDIFRSNLAPAS